MVFCGRQAIDGDTAQVGPQIAEKLRIPQITYVEKLEIKDKEIIAHRAIEDGYFVIKSKMPILLTAINSLNEPRYPSLWGINKAFNKQEIEIWTCDDIKIEKEKIGLKGSPTRVKKTFTPNRKFKGEILKGVPKEVCKNLVIKLKERHVI